MARSRKTAEVAQIKQKANHYLAWPSTEITPDMRKGVASLLETILMDTNSYAGFRYLDGWPCKDESRREYY